MWNIYILPIWQHGNESLNQHYAFERFNNIWLFYKLMLQTWKSIVLVPSRIWPFTHMLDTQHFSFLSNWLQFNFILHFSLSKKIKRKTFFFLTTFQKGLEGYLTIYKEYTWTIARQYSCRLWLYYRLIQFLSQTFLFSSPLYQFDTSDIFSITWK